MRKKHTYTGQTFVEVIIVFSIVITVVMALVAGSIPSFKLSIYNKMKLQSLKYAQEGVELLRKMRDDGWNDLLAMSRPSPQIWCLNKEGIWSRVPQCPTNIDNTFTRSVELSYDSVNQRILAIIRVSWPDGSQIRITKLETFFTHWR